MTRSNKTEPEEMLDEEVVQALGAAQQAIDVSPARLTKLRARVMQTIDAEVDSESSFVTIRSEEGTWVEISPKTHKKVLSVNDDSGIETYLLRLESGAGPDRHFHEHDEFCVVLTGDVSFDDVKLEVGDYHFAPAGSWHGSATSTNGAVLFIQSVPA